MKHIFKKSIKEEILRQKRVILAENIYDIMLNAFTLVFIYMVNKETPESIEIGIEMWFPLFCLGLAKFCVLIYKNQISLWKMIKSIIWDYFKPLLGALICVGICLLNLGDNWVIAGETITDTIIIFAFYAMVLGLTFFCVTIALIIGFLAKVLKENMIKKKSA